MDLASLRYVTVVAETQNLQQAAALLHVTPAALSKAVKRVEVEFNVQLFHRTGRQLTLTPEGRAFCGDVSTILQDMQTKLYEHKHSDEYEAMPIRIGSFDVFTSYFLALAAEHVPETVWEIHDLSPGKLEDALSRRVIDVGLSYVPVPHPELDFISLSQVTMGIYGRDSLMKNHKWDQLPFAVPITPVDGNPTRVEGLDGWPDHQFPRQRQFRVTRLETALALCRRGMCIGFFPKFVVDLHNQTVRRDYELSEMPLPKGLQHAAQEIYLIKRKHEPETIAMRTLAKLVRKLC